MRARYLLEHKSIPKYIFKSTTTKTGYISFGNYVNGHTQIDLIVFFSVNLDIEYFFLISS